MGGSERSGVAMRIDRQQKTRVIENQSGVDGTINWEVQQKFETRGIFDSRIPGATSEDQGPGYGLMGVIDREWKKN